MIATTMFMGYMFLTDAFVVCGWKNPQLRCLAWVDQCIRVEMVVGGEYESIFENCAERAETVMPDLFSQGESK
jgi:hypothetical protein